MKLSHIKNIKLHIVTDIKRKIKYLGHVISERSIEVDPDCVKSCDEKSKSGSLNRIFSWLNRFITSQPSVKGGDG